jgi:hypothetical protein
VSGPDTQQAPPEPPPPPSGSPFGRFLTAPVLMATALALVVSAVAVQFIPRDGSGGSAPPKPTGIAGSWSGAVQTADAGGGAVRLELEAIGTGTLTVGRCTGTLAPVRAGAETAIYVYTETSAERGCPRRSRVRVTLVDEDTLRFVQRRGDRTLASATLQRS